MNTSESMCYANVMTNSFLLRQRSVEMYHNKREHTLLRLYNKFQ